MKTKEEKRRVGKKGVERRRGREEKRGEEMAYLRVILLQKFSLVLNEKRKIIKKKKQNCNITRNWYFIRLHPKKKTTKSRTGNCGKTKGPGQVQWRKTYKIRPTITRLNRNSIRGNSNSAMRSIYRAKRRCQR